jgi:hypothetical protein
MKSREFDKLLNSLVSKCLLDLDKIPVLLTDEQRTGMVHYLVRHRCPIVKELIPDGFDWAWLHSCGYLHITKGQYNNFVHTEEQRIVTHSYLF